MPSLWFVVPAYGRQQLARICLRQLRRTCDALTAHGIHATAVVVGDDENLGTARDLGFATVERDNRFVSRKFNDGIDLACDPFRDTPRPEPDVGRYLVTGTRGYRGHLPGTEFEARLDPAPERRAVARGDIRLLERVRVAVGRYTLPDGVRPADFVVPCGSDDWVDWRLLVDLPPEDTFVGFQRISFVREDGAELTCRYLGYKGGAGIRIYPRQLMHAVGFRPADEDRERACDTSILVNLQRKHGEGLKVLHPDNDARQIVDWKSRGEQLNTYESLSIHRGEVLGDPFAELREFFPAESLEEMQAHYQTELVAA